jgi:DNA-binding MarR family transcriptional regulator
MTTQTFNFSRDDQMVTQQFTLIDIFTSAENLHRQFLDLIQAELEAFGYRDINNVRALILLNIGEDEMTASELLWRGCYLGTNVSYNLKKLTETGYVVQTRSQHDRRVVMVRNSEKGVALCQRLQQMNNRHIAALSEVGVTNEEVEGCRKVLRTLERFCTRAIDIGKARRPRTDVAYSMAA